MFNSPMPPYSNTGAENTNRNNSYLTAKIDWLAFTLKCVTVNQVLDLFPGLSFFDTRGQFGYKSGIMSDGILILYDGTDDMGVHCSFSGQGCDYIERQFGIFNFVNLLKSMFKLINFTRVDIALDDRVGILNMETIDEHIKNGWLVSRFKTATMVRKIVLESGEIKGDTFYFGNPSSRIRFRVYDKAKEQNIEGHWIRFEVQLREERANNFINCFFDPTTFFDNVRGIIANYLIFKEKTEDSNKSRWPVASWFQDFIGASISLVSKCNNKNIYHKKAWLDNQVSKTLYIALDFFGYDTILDYINLGKSKLRKKDIEWLREQKKLYLLECASTSDY